MDFFIAAACSAFLAIQAWGLATLVTLKSDLSSTKTDIKNIKRKIFNEH